MHLLQGCTIPSPQFASLSLLIDTESISSDIGNNNNTIDTKKCTFIGSLSGESIIVPSPLATTTQKNAMGSLSSLHTHLLPRYRGSNNDRKTMASSINDRSSPPRKNGTLSLPSSSTHRRTGRKLTSRQQQQQQQKQNTSNINGIGAPTTTVQYYRDPNNGLALYYTICTDPSIIQRCIYLLLPSHGDTTSPTTPLSSAPRFGTTTSTTTPSLSSSKKPTPLPSSKRNKKQPPPHILKLHARLTSETLALITCVGLAGNATLHRSSPLVTTLPSKLPLGVVTLSKLATVYGAATEGKVKARGVLSHLLFEEDDLRANREPMEGSGGSVGEVKVGSSKPGSIFNFAIGGVGGTQSTAAAAAAAMAAAMEEELNEMTTAEESRRDAERLTILTIGDEVMNVVPSSLQQQRRRRGMSDGSESPPPPPDLEGFDYIPSPEQSMATIGVAMMTAEQRMGIIRPSSSAMSSSTGVSIKAVPRGQNKQQQQQQQTLGARRLVTQQQQHHPAFILPPTVPPQMTESTSFASSAFTHVSTEQNHQQQQQQNYNNNMTTTPDDLFQQQQQRKLKNAAILQRQRHQRQHSRSSQRTGTPNSAQSPAGSSSGSSPREDNLSSGGNNNNNNTGIFSPFDPSSQHHNTTLSASSPGGRSSADGHSSSTGASPFFFESQTTTTTTTTNNNTSPPRGVINASSSTNPTMPLSSSDTAWTASFDPFMTLDSRGRQPSSATGTTMSMTRSSLDTMEGDDRSSDDTPQQQRSAQQQQQGTPLANFIIPPSHDDDNNNNRSTRKTTSGNMTISSNKSSKTATYTVESKGSSEETSTMTDSIRTGSEKNMTTMVVSVALNEDLTCSYRSSKLASCSIEGVVQIHVKSNATYDIPFYLRLRDPSQHVKTIQENKKFARDSTSEISSYNDVDDEDEDVDYRFTVNVPKSDHYYPVVRYKCGSELRPVPIRVQTRTRLNENICRVALQISSNPSNTDELTDLTILMAVPPTVRGESLVTSPPGGMWNGSKRSVLWCVSELGVGEKFQLQAQFEMVEEVVVEEGEKPSFPVLVRCQCMYAQLSGVEWDVGEIVGQQQQQPVDVRMRLARRFRLSHREKS